MTAPDTNLKKQKKRHKGPLIGMAIAVIVAVLFLIWMLSQNLGTDTPEQEAAPSQVEETVGPPASGSVSGPSDTGAPQTFEPDEAPEPEPVPGN